jgi:OOP family OmpA-OmpF porin
MNFCGGTRDFLPKNHFCPNSTWVLSLLFGAGASRGIDVKNFNHVAAKAGVGLDYFLNTDFSLGPQVNYYYVSEKDDSIRHLHALGVGLAANYFFGGRRAAPQPAPIKQAAPPPAPAPVPVALALQPAQATLGPSGTQAFRASVTGTENQGVDWSLNPSLGSIDAGGTYTAPAQIAFPEKVTVTATSQADRTKSAQSVVSLTPPAAAPKQVSIQLSVLFDTAKDVVKPEYLPEIQRVAEFMKSYPSTKAEIEGHTDSVGSADYNRGLSQRRADAVRKTLIEKFGIPDGRLTAKGYGPDKPIADNGTAEGRAKNRRVVATLTATN